jgi:hypothetical protein
MRPAAPQLCFWPAQVTASVGRHLQCSPLYSRVPTHLKVPEMSESPATYQVELSLGSLVYLSALVAFSGGCVFGTLSAIYKFLHAEWLAGLAAIPITPIVGALAGAMYALLGYPLYKYFSRRTPIAGKLTGIFVKESTPNRVREGF